jgi:hypothetical protein
VRPIASVDELVRPDLFESDEELDSFLADVREARQCDELMTLAQVADVLGVAAAGRTPCRRWQSAGVHPKD